MCEAAPPRWPDLNLPVETRAQDVVGEPVLLYEYGEPFRIDAGESFVVRVYQREPSHGTWIGWLTFVGTEGQVRPTARETTQSTREHLVYRATGLQQSFLEGAVNRASSVGVPTPGRHSQPRSPGLPPRTMTTAIEPHVRA
jgi:hypothetical protein